MSDRLTAYFQLLTDEARQPTKAHSTDAGWDLYTSRPAVIGAGQAEDIHTDVAIALPEGWYCHIITRSSTLRRYNLLVMEAVIDQGYRGEMFVQVFNPASDPVEIPTGVRLAQLIVLPVPTVEWVRTLKLPNSPRSTNGFGSSGL